MIWYAEVETATPNQKTDGGSEQRPQPCESSAAEQTVDIAQVLEQNQVLQRISTLQS
jgi:dihydroorotase-like cyclic amidohydrolase